MQESSLGYDNVLFFTFLFTLKYLNLKHISHNKTSYYVNYKIIKNY